MSDLWFTVLRWTLLAALVAAVIGVPVVYHQRTLKAAYEQGQVVGKSACETAHAEAAAVALKAAQAQLQVESNKAQAAAAKAQVAQSRATQLQGKLNEALKNQPEATSCLLNESATSVLRDFATDGSSDHRAADSVSKPNAPEMSRKPFLS